jgi:hypothetical protein
MEYFLKQAAHNKNFIECLQDKFPDNFYDWKITATFYEAIHYLKALALYRQCNIGETHYDIFNNVNPHSKRNPSMQINKTAWYCYITLYNYSKSARYDGIADPDTMEILRKIDFEDGQKALDSFKKYIVSQGVSIPGVTLSK